MSGSRILCAAVACAALMAGTADARERRPPTEVSAVQRATIPVLRQPPARTVPLWVRQFARRVPIGGTGFYPNAKLARAVVPAGRSKPWYVIPADGAVCLLTDAKGGTCAWDRQVRRGELWMALIDPVGELPVPAPGQPVPSTIVGVAPEGVTGVTASTVSGVTATGQVQGGLYTMVTSDVTAIHLHRGPVDVTIPDFNATG